MGLHCTLAMWTLPQSSLLCPITVLSMTRSEASYIPQAETDRKWLLLTNMVWFQWFVCQVKYAGKGLWMSRVLYFSYCHLHTSFYMCTHFLLAVTSRALNISADHLSSLPSITLPLTSPILPPPPPPPPPPSTRPPPLLPPPPPCI